MREQTRIVRRYSSFLRSIARGETANPTQMSPQELRDLAIAVEMKQLTNIDSFTANLGTSITVYTNTRNLDRVHKIIENEIETALHGGVKPPEFLRSFSIDGQSTSLSRFLTHITADWTILGKTIVSFPRSNGYFKKLFKKADPLVEQFLQSDDYGRDLPDIEFVPSKICEEGSLKLQEIKAATLVLTRQNAESTIAASASSTDSTANSPIDPASGLTSDAAE